MKHLLHLVLLAVLPISALANHFGTVTSTDQTPLANVKIVSMLTNDTLFSDENGKFGTWPDAVQQNYNIVRTINGSTVYNNQLYFSATKAGEAVKATVVSPRGQVIWDYSGHSKVKGINTLPCENSFAQGVYFLRLTVGEKEYVSKVTNTTPPTYVSEMVQTTVATRMESGMRHSTEDTLIVTCQGHLRTTIVADTETNTPLSIALTPCVSLPTVSIDKDSVKVVTGTSVTLNLTAADSTGDITDFLWGTDPAALTNSAPTGIFTVTVAKGVTTYYAIAKNEYDMVSAVDSVVVTGEDASIILDAPDTMSINEDSELVITTDNLVITDNNGSGPYTVVVAEPADGSKYSVKDGNTIVPNADFFGNLTISMYVTDGNLHSNSDTVVVKVLPTSDAPVFDSVVVAGVKHAITNGEIAITVNEINDAKNVVLYLSDIDNISPTMEIAKPNGVTWISDISGDAFEYNFDIVPASYDIAKNGTDKEYSFTVTASDPDNAAIKSELTVKLTVKSVNRAPVITSIPSQFALGIGNTCTLSVVVSDPDGDENLTLTNDAGFIVRDSSLIKSQDYGSKTPGEAYTMKVTVSDGIDSTSENVSVVITTHQWKEYCDLSSLGADTLIGVTATDASKIHVLRSNCMLSNYVDGALLSTINLGGIYQGNSKTLSDMTSTMYYGKVKQYGDSIYCEYAMTGAYWGGFSLATGQGNFQVVEGSRGNGAFAKARNSEDLFIFKQNSRIVGGQVGVIQVYTVIDPYIANVTIPEFEGSPNDVEAAYNGVNIFASDGAYIYHKAKASDEWYAQVSTKDIVDFEIASNSGDILYAREDNGAVLLCTNGLASGSGLSFSETKMTNALDVKSINSKIAWAIDATTGELKFTSNQFKNGSISTENIGGKKAKFIVVSEDKQTVFIVTESDKVYR